MSIVLASHQKSLFRDFLKLLDLFAGVVAPDFAHLEEDLLNQAR